ncbi:MAG: hypothetical protein E7483_00860 [Ruminococcaceae bacterium]|nr:hypothetical protein [Oscillospiraceae bacterium]
MGMFTMKPIDEYDVIELLNNGRFEGDLYGYVLSDGGDLFGYTLFKIEDNTTVMLDSKTPDGKFSGQYLDGIIRASIAYGEARGAEYFSFNMNHLPFAEYKRIFFGDQPDRMKTSVIFSGCKHD